MVDARFRRDKHAHADVCAFDLMDGLAMVCMVVCEGHG
jgi:hypothetical protein